MMLYWPPRILCFWIAWNCAYGLTQRMVRVKRTLTMLKMRSAGAAGCRLDANRDATWDDNWLSG
jgi:hypothetical protein